MTRSQVRQQTDRQKVQLINRFEKIKKRGKFSRNEMIRMGVFDDEQAAINEIFGSPSESNKGEQNDPDSKIQIQDFESDDQFERTVPNKQIKNPQGQGSLFYQTAVEDDEVSSKNNLKIDKLGEKNECKSTQDVPIDQSVISLPPPGDLRTLHNFE